MDNTTRTFLFLFDTEERRRRVVLFLITSRDVFAFSQQLRSYCDELILDYLEPVGELSRRSLAGSFHDADYLEIALDIWCEAHGISRDKALSQRAAA